MTTLENIEKTTARKERPEMPKSPYYAKKNLETAMCAESGMQYHVSQSLCEALTPCLMPVILSTVCYFRYLERYDL